MGLAEAPKRPLRASDAALFVCGLTSMIPLHDLVMIMSLGVMEAKLASKEGRHADVAMILQDVSHAP